mmetsp:Transcript_47619/g.125774  ORF Transcript_47619/g.125774 Transcript_47619/m.125774 type:complete len:362 (-) Transcript_47619:613-1698(-)
MFFALATLGSVLQCPELKVGQALKASVALNCVAIEASAVPAGQIIKIDADAGAPGTRLCLRVQALNHPNTALRDVCGDESSRVSVSFSERMPDTFVVMPRTSPGGVPPNSLRLSAQQELAPSPPVAAHPAAASHSGLLGSPSPPLAKSPPGAPPPDPDNADCNKIEEDTLAYALTFCEADRQRLCAGVEGRSEILTCLDQHKGEESTACADAMSNVNECLLTPHLLVPMTIASILLLATASMVLLCTLLRCCCRYICILPIHPADDASTVHDEELSADEEEPASYGSVTPLPSGVKAADTPQPEPSSSSYLEEDELPAYVEVVQGASIARSGGSTKDTAPKEPMPAREPARDGYRPDVQLQ